MADNAGGRWTKWWWLRYFGVETWTDEERRARIAMGCVVLAVAVVAIPTFGFVLELFGMERHAAAVTAAVISSVIGLIAARPVATLFLTELVRRADHNAADRLSRSNNKS